MNPFDASLTEAVIAVSGFIGIIFIICVVVAIMKWGEPGEHDREQQREPLCTTCQLLDMGEMPYTGFCPECGRVPPSRRTTIIYQFNTINIF